MAPTWDMAPLQPGDELRLWLSRTGGCAAALRPPDAGLALRLGALATGLYY